MTCMSPWSRPEGKERMNTWKRDKVGGLARGDIMLSDDVLYEIEALKAIYGDDYEDRPSVWNNASFSIRIRPIRQEEIFSRSFPVHMGDFYI